MRVLISAGGTVTAQSIVKGLREDGRATFIAVGDMDPLCATKAFVDEFVLLPAAGSADAASAYLDAARRLRVDLFIPLIVEREFLPLDAIRQQFDEVGCALWVPPRDVVVTASDKLAFAAFLDRYGLPGVPTVPYAHDMRVAGFPVFLKPRRGSGSVGVKRIESAPSLHEAARGRADLVVQPVMEGREFTVDCFAAGKGNVVSAVPRERIAVKAGVSVKGRTVHDARIEGVAAAVVERSGIVGAANVQGMLRADGDFRVIEMNPRFSGTLALTTAAGVNFVSLLLDYVEGKAIPDLRGAHRAGVTMLRYWSEVFESADGSMWGGTPMDGAGGAGRAGPSPL